MTTYRRENRIAKIVITENGYAVDFTEDGEAIGRINYFDKSLSYVEDACENFVSGLIPIPTIKFYMEDQGEQLEFNFDEHQGGVENWAVYNR